jgi:hypothetical protein
MADHPEDDATPDGVSAEAASDRRRAGRSAHVSPELIPLLRNAATAEIPDDAVPASGAVDIDREPFGLDADNLGAARGLATGLVLGVSLWGLIGLAAWWLIG